MIEAQFTNLSSVANAVKIKGVAVNLLESEDGFLCFQVHSSLGLTSSFLTQAFGDVLSRLRKGVKAYGYAIESKPEIIDESIYFRLRTSIFHGKLANLVEGYATREEYVQDVVGLLDGDLDSQKLMAAISLLQAVESHSARYYRKN